MCLILNVWCFVIPKVWFGVILKLVFVICIFACWQHLSYRKYCDNASRLNSALSLRLWIWKLSSWNLTMFVILKLDNVVILTLYLLAISKLGILSSPAPCSGSKELKLQQMVVTWACARSLIPSLPSFAMGRPVIPSSGDKWTTPSNHWTTPRHLAHARCSVNRFKVYCGRSFPWTRSSPHRCLVNESVVLSVNRTNQD